MNNIWKIFKRDCHLVRTNLIAMVVAFGLVVIPSLYAWFNIAAEWDPYSNTGGIRVAVANDDAGYTSELMPLTVNMGDQVESALRENTQLEWIFTTSDDAVEGVRSGTYYAALVIPEDFTSDMLNVLTGDEDHPTITYYSNQKESAIAPKVTDQGADTVRTTVNTVFTETITEIGASLTEQLANYLDSDQIESVANRLTSTLSSASSDLREASSQVNSFATLMQSTSGLVSSSEALLDSSSGTGESLNKLLSDGKSDVDTVTNSVADTTSKANGAISDVTNQLDEADKLVQDAFAAGEGSKGDVCDALDTAGYQLVQQSITIDGYAEKIQSAIDTIEPTGVDVSALKKVHAQLVGLSSNLYKLGGQLNDAAIAINENVSTEQEEEIRALIEDAKSQITELSTKYEEQLASQAQSLSSALSNAQSNGSAVSSSLESTLRDLKNLVAGTSNDIADATANLSEAASTLSQSADDLDTISSDVSAALASGDLDKVRQIIADNPQALAEAISDPIGLDTEAIWEMENTGSSMAAYFSTLATWVGCVVLAAMLKVTVSKSSQNELEHAKPRHLYFGRFLFFWMLGILQSTLIGLGDLLFLKIQCQSPILFMASCWIASTVFMSIVYALVVSFGDVGKAIGVVFMVLQVAGAGGIFPVEVMPDFFQAAYPFLPFVHSMNMMKYCIAGGLAGEWLQECAFLLAFIVPALLLGLALRKPVVRLNEWFMEELEDTKLM